MKNEILSEIKEYFKDNPDIFNECLEEADGWDGLLGDDRYYNMEKIDDLFSDNSITDILNRAYFGYDEETYTTDGSGQRDYGQFNPNRNYFRFNGYGNLVSADYPDYSDQLDDYTIQRLCEDRQHIDSIDRYDELSELFDALEENGIKEEF